MTVDHHPPPGPEARLSALAERVSHLPASHWAYLAPALDELEKLITDVAFDALTSDPAPVPTASPLGARLREVAGRVDNLHRHRSERRAADGRHPAPGSAFRLTAALAHLSTSVEDIEELVEAIETDRLEQVVDQAMATARRHTSLELGVVPMEAARRLLEHFDGDRDAAVRWVKRLSVAALAGFGAPSNHAVTTEGLLRVSPSPVEAAGELVAALGGVGELRAFVLHLLAELDE